MSDKPILFNMTLAELEQFAAGLGQPRFRAKQIQEWLRRGAPDFSVMKNLPEDFRRMLDDSARTMPCFVEKKLESSDGQTTKFLLKLNDGEAIETVLMRTSYGNSVCVSSQAGCAMGCRFCASTLMGLRRNLTANEMTAQVLVAGWQLRQSLEFRVESLDSQSSQLSTLNSKLSHDHNMSNEITHIVVMGTGEPLHNIENLKGFLEDANAKLGISWRRMTISTCGIVPGIKEITEWGRPVSLAVSLHAPDDMLRSALMPINNKYRIAEVLDAAFAHSEKTGRQLMIEYILLDSPELSNHSAEQAGRLAELLRGKNAMVNLIPWNAVEEREFAAPSNNAVHRFQDILIKGGIHTRIRRERGADIGSACGQLRLHT